MAILKHDVTKRMKLKTWSPLLWSVLIESDNTREHYFLPGILELCNFGRSFINETALPHKMAFIFEHWKSEWAYIGANKFAFDKLISAVLK